MAITDETINEYRKIISQYWKVFERAFVDDFGSDAMWAEVIEKVNRLAKEYSCDLSQKIAYAVLDEMNRTQKQNGTLDKKVIYNVFLDCGNSLREANNWDRYNNLLHTMYPKYKGMRFAEQMFDIFQNEVARSVIT